MFSQIFEFEEEEGEVLQLYWRKFEDKILQLWFETIILIWDECYGYKKPRLDNEISELKLREFNQSLVGLKLFWMRDHLLANLRVIIEIQGSAISAREIEILSIVMDPGQKFLTWKGSDQQSFIRVRKISPKNAKFLNFFLQVKNNLIGLGPKVPGSMMGWPLFYCGSKVCSGWVRAHL